MDQTLSPYAELSLSVLAPSPTNPRKQFADLQELAASISAQGVMQPILVRPWPDDYPTPEGRTERPLYEIVAGERRYRAALLAALTNIPALCRPLTTRQVLEAQIVENLQRRDVTELEEAEGYQLMMRDHGYTADQLADKVGKSRAYIYARLKLCALSADVRTLFREGKLDASRALLIARIPVPALQLEAATRIIEGDWQGPWSYRQAAQHIKANYMLDLTKAPFDPAGHYVIKVTGMMGAGGVGAITCTECPNRTGNDPEAYPDVSPDVCTDPTCFADKRAAHLAQAAAAEREAGRKVITGDQAKKIAPHGIYSKDAGDYVVLDAEDYYGGKATTARKALKGQDVPIVMLEDVRKGKLVPVVHKQALREGLKAAGVDVRITRPGADIEKEKARKAEQQYRRALFEAHHEAARTAINLATRPALSRDDLALIARQFWAARGSETSKRLARLYVPDAPEPGPKYNAYDDDDARRSRRMTEMLGEFNGPQLMLFLLDVALVATLDVPTYCDDITTPLPLISAAIRAGVDPVGIRFALTAGKAASTAAQMPPETAPTPPQAAPAAEASAPEKPLTGLAVAAEVAARTKNPVMYRHPYNESLRWSGRGKKPAWVEDWLTKGGALEDLAPQPTTEEASEPAPTPNQAAPAAVTPPAEPAPAKPARAKKAAPASGETTAGKGKKEAASAAKKPKVKAKDSGRASPAKRKGKTTEASSAGEDAERDTRTIDMIAEAFPELGGGETATQGQQEARA